MSGISGMLPASTTACPAAGGWHQAEGWRGSRSACIRPRASPGRRGYIARSLATAARARHSLPSAATMPPSLGAIGLTGGLPGFFPGMPSVYLGAHDLAAPDYLSRFRAHGAAREI